MGVQKYHITTLNNINNVLQRLKEMLDQKNE